MRKDVMSSDVHIFRDAGAPCGSFIILLIQLKVISAALPSTVFCVHPQSEVPSNLALKPDNSYTYS